MATDLFNQPITRKRKSKRWTPEGVAIYVYGGMFDKPVPVVMPIRGNKLETRFAAVDTDRTLHLVAESDQFGINCVNYAKRFAKAGFNCRCYVGSISKEGFFRAETRAIKRTAAEKRATKKMGIRN